MRKIIVTEFITLDGVIEAPGGDETTHPHGGWDRIPKYVVSRSLRKVEWNNSHILRDVAKDVAALKNSDGGNIPVYGSATLVKDLLHNDLIHELRLMVFPLSIGGG